MAVPKPIPKPAQSRPSWRAGLSVYLQPRVLIVMLLGFSAGLPFSLAGQTLQAWMTESGVDIKTIGLFAAIGVPYLAKFAWSPAVDALDVPLLSRIYGRRRGWLLLTQLMLIAAIGLLALSDPSRSPALVALAALLVTTASATQDIVIDAFRVESLPDEEQAAGMASYVAAYRIAALVSGAGALFLVSGLVSLGLDKQHAYGATYLMMALLVLVGIVATLAATEPAQSVPVEADHAAHAQENALRRLTITAIASFKDFFRRDAAVAILLFVTLFKLADALAAAMTTTFVLKIGFSRIELATIVKGVGFAAALLGGFAGGFVARAYPLRTSLWIGGLLQTVAILAFSWQAIVGADARWLTFTIAAEYFTGGVGTVTFVAYLSALCNNPLHTATQFALLTALAAFGRTIFALGSGYLAEATGWAGYFALCTASAIPSFVLLVWLQRRGHFEALGPVKV
ncbi:AmpG family muropeptide MFS transporter [Bradyrhizobium sp.]|uniref:AmpG family muropeptide MFS transporter n=1 Tax=Bradyrhizobium sp. TaxID=376 RepID=UPI003C7689BD